MNKSPWLAASMLFMLLVYANFSCIYALDQESAFKQTNTEAVDDNNRDELNLINKNEDTGLSENPQGPDDSIVKESIAEQSNTVPLFGIGGASGGAISPNNHQSGECVICDAHCECLGFWIFRECYCVADWAVNCELKKCGPQTCPVI